MKDQACICFLQWALPHLQMRWPGFRKVRGQVCKRLRKRLDELQLADLREYRAYLDNNPLEWHLLDAMCRITISRFYRDKGIFDSMVSRIFPELSEYVKSHGGKKLSCWCTGAASGEEPYTLSLLWDLAGFKRQGFELSILATEIDPQMINRARIGCYPASSVKELPPQFIDRAFIKKGRDFCLSDRFKQRVSFRQQDIRNTWPDAAFHLILCRNLVFTYFSHDLQEKIFREIYDRLLPGGFLVIGSHEKLYSAPPGLTGWIAGQPVFRKNLPDSQ